MEQERLSIAVVDDDAAMRKALGRILRLAGYDVATYSSAEEFLDRGSPELPGCLVLDVHLDGMSGPELREELSRGGKPVAVVFITAQDEVVAGCELREVPGVPCLCKPFDDELLLGAIDRVTGGGKGAAPSAGPLSVG